MRKKKLREKWKTSIIQELPMFLDKHHPILKDYTLEVSPDLVLSVDVKLSNPRLLKIITTKYRGVVINKTTHYVDAFPNPELAFRATIKGIRVEPVGLVYTYAYPVFTAQSRLDLGHHFATNFTEPSNEAFLLPKKVTYDFGKFKIGQHTVLSRYELEDSNTVPFELVMLHMRLFRENVKKQYSVESILNQCKVN
jgi:hypothetical protein